MDGRCCSFAHLLSIHCCRVCLQRSGEVGSRSWNVTGFRARRSPSRKTKGPSRSTWHLKINHLNFNLIHPYNFLAFRRERFCDQSLIVPKLDSTHFHDFHFSMVSEVLNHSVIIALTLVQPTNSEALSNKAVGSI